jgi:hypothetical protein
MTSSGTGIIRVLKCAGSRCVAPPSPIAVALPAAPRRTGAAGPCCGGVDGLADGEHDAPLVRDRAAGQVGGVVAAAEPGLVSDAGPGPQLNGGAGGGHDGSCAGDGPGVRFLRLGEVIPAAAKSGSGCGCHRPPTWHSRMHSRAWLTIITGTNWSRRIRRCRLRAGCKTSCPGPVQVAGLRDGRRAGRVGERCEGLVDHRERVRGQGVLGGDGGKVRIRTEEQRRGSFRRAFYRLPFVWAPGSLRPGTD